MIGAYAELRHDDAALRQRIVDAGADETAGGIVQALPLLGPEPFLLVNSDIYTAFDYATLATGSREPTLVLVPNPAHNTRGDFGVDATGRVSAAPPLMTYAGIAVHVPRSFAGLERGRRPLKPLLDAAIARRELRGVVFSGLWFDVGTPERLEDARRVAGK